MLLLIFVLIVNNSNRKMIAMVFLCVKYILHKYVFNVPLLFTDSSLCSAAWCSPYFPQFLNSIIYQTKACSYWWEVHISHLSLCLSTFCFITFNIYYLNPCSTPCLTESLKLVRLFTILSYRARLCINCKMVEYHCYASLTFPKQRIKQSTMSCSYNHA